MIEIPWLDKLHVLTMREDRIGGVWIDKGVSLMVYPYTNEREGATLLTARKLVVKLEHLGSGTVVADHTHMKIADPDFFGVVEDLLERMING